MDQFIQLTVDALTLGSVYALIALGYTLVYGVLKLLNFAHGDVFMVGTFVGYGVLQVLGGPANPSVPIWLLIAAVAFSAMAVCAGLGVAIERFAYRPLRDAPRIAPLISALGVSFFLANSMQLLFGAQPRNYDIFTLDNASLATAGARLGTGMVAVFPAGRCGLAETARVVRYLALESAGQCGPCLNGLPRIATALADLAAARSRPGLLDDLARWSGLVTGRGACHHPDGTARFVASALRTFASEVAVHQRGGCTATDTRPFLPVPAPAAEGR